MQPSEKRSLFHSPRLNETPRKKISVDLSIIIQLHHNALGLSVFRALSS